MCERVLLNGELYIGHRTFTLLCGKGCSDPISMGPSLQMMMEVVVVVKRCEGDDGGGGGGEEV